MVIGFYFEYYDDCAYLKYAKMMPKGDTMAINRLEFYSEKLQMNTRVNVILPDHPKDKGKILLLLHGLHDDENSWIDQTRLVSYASKTQIAIIMPRADHSYYTNRDGDSRYFDYIGEEVLQRCQQWFNLSPNPADIFIAGVSMGGFGALKVGLTHPTQYRQIFALSAVPDIHKQWEEKPKREKWFRSLFGSPEQVKNSNNDIAYLISQQNTNAPAIWQLCGVDDPYYQMNIMLHEQIDHQGLKHEFIEVPGGHEWNVWDSAIKQVLQSIEQA